MDEGIKGRGELFEQDEGSINQDSQKITRLRSCRCFSECCVKKQIFTKTLYKIYTIEEMPLRSPASPLVEGSDAALPLDIPRGYPGGGYACCIPPW